MPNVFILNAYADEFGRNRMRASDIWVDTVPSNDPTGAGYVAYSGFNPNVVFEIPYEGTHTTALTAAARQALVNFVAANPDFTSAAWCANGGSVPYKYCGVYYAMSARQRLLSETAFDCPHCALIEARRVNTLADQPHVLCGPAGRAIPSHYTAQTGVVEIAGEARPADTSTLKDYTGSPGYTCGNCGRLGHNARSCTNHARFFDKIGVEVEGRFLDLRAMQRVADNLGATYSGDGSIHDSPDSNAAGYEFKTKPGNLRETIEQVVAFFPDETDRSCGMHIHMSFAQDCLTLLNTKEFFAFFKARWRAWGTAMGLHPEGEFFKRLDGDNDYCLPNDSPRRVMHDGERYEQLNFTAWRGHKTLECRLLPMFRRSSLAVAAIQELVAIYEDFLAAAEQHIEFPAMVPAGVPVEMSLTPTVLARIELDLPTLRTHSQRHEMELEQLAPPADNMVRIALPVNQPITVEALSTRLAALRAA